MARQEGEPEVTAPASFFRRRGEARRPRPAPGLEPGKTVGDFRLVALLGQGGMGQVWEAVQVSLGRPVAVKFVRPERVTERELELFAREARAGGRLSHPGLVTVHGHGTSDGLAWIAMELVPGAWTLRDFLDGALRADELPPGHDREVARLVAEIADAMQAAHEAGVIHRDLKPQNVLLTPDDRPKVTDFGLARIADETALSRTGEIAGTYLYMSPEQVAAKRIGIDHRTDVFSLGVVLYELLALRRPFQGDTEHQVAAQILLRDPPDPRTIRSRVPRDLAVIAAKCLEKDPDKRFPAMRALADDLRRHLAAEPIRARPPTPLDRASKWVRRNPAKSTAAAMATAAFLAIGLLLVENVRARRAAEDNAVRARDSELRAEAEAEDARRRAEQVLRLSALQRLDDLTARARDLWPARPERLADGEAWLAEARALERELPDHERNLAELEAELAAAPRDEGLRWWSQQLAKLVERLRDLHDPERGLAGRGLSPEHGWGVARRADFARSLVERTVAGPEAAWRWAEALESIGDAAECPAYGGLRLAPQVGLLPLGRDPRSGLWEFADLQTGEPPERGAGGELVPGESTGLVLVLLPGGTFAMGAQRADPAGPNFDPRAESDERPVHAVTLSPFFLSKWEMTQGQWLRFTGANPSGYSPSSYHPKSNRAGRPGTLAHPVEQVSWSTCVEVLARMGLELPSEAQWEYAARGGTDTPWWTGAEPHSLRVTPGHATARANLLDAFARRTAPEWVGFEDWLDDGNTVHAPVGSYAPNPFGLHDVIGNVWEWCRDGYAQDAYARSSGSDPMRDPVRDPVRDPRGLPYRVNRGGAFDQVSSRARSANRDSISPDNAYGQQGLRPARRVE